MVPDGFLSCISTMGRMYLCGVRVAALVLIVPADMLGADET